jgi:glycosyltransferase involved in cell wall biosynthesis
VTDPERQLSAANRELERRSQDVQTLVRWIEELEEQRSRDAQTLIHLITRLNAAYSSLLNSRRWKIGSVIVEFGRRALFRPNAPEGTGDPSEIEENFRAWQKEFSARQEEFRTRREEFVARREYLDPTKGRPGMIELEDPRNVAADAQPLVGHFGAAEHILSDLRDLEPVSIVVPIQTAPGNLKNCLESVVGNTTAPAELLLIVAASADPGTSSLLAEYEALENVRVLTGDGFARAVNLGFSESGGDVVVLDASVEVAPRWLENLTLAAYADPRTATVAAISGGADEFSVPDGIGKDEMGRHVMQRSAQVYPQTPAEGGLCTYIKRTALDDVGPLAAETFPQGYGALEDFCLRAWKRGWNHVVDDTTFVFYEGSGSEEALVAAREILDGLHPEYEKLARAFASSEDTERVGENVRAAFSGPGPGRAKPRVLFVLHQAGGGAPYTTRDLMDALADRYSSYVLVSDALRLRLFRYRPEGPVLADEWSLGRKWRATEFSRPDYRAIVFELLVKYRFELVHVMHLLGHTFDLPEVAARLRIPVVLTFHDFYFSCPTMHLIDDRGKHCGGICTPGYGECRLPRALIGEVPDLKHRWLKTWRRHVERMFDHVDVFVTASFATKETYLNSLPGLRDRTFEVIEHGRDLEQEHLAVPPGDGPIRILIPGNIAVHKGAEFLRKLKRADAEKRLELHFLGNVVKGFRGLGVMHGRYKREEFNSRVREIGPSFVGIFSIWPEIYCHTLTEAWAAGVPTLVSDIGTLRERLEAHGGGWLLDHEDPQRSYERIIEIAEDRASYARELERANLRGIRSTREMADDHQSLYENLLRRRRPIEKPAS